MSYRLKMARIESIHALYQQGWSQRRIAHELDLNRETVARYLKGDPETSKPATAPLGSLTESDDSKPATAPTGSDGKSNPPPGATDSPISPPNRASGCEPWRAVIKAKIELGLSAQRIYQDLTTEHGFQGSYFSVRRFVRRLTARMELPVRRFESEPGGEAQVDFGTGAPLCGPDGKRRKTYVFRIVLSHSRKAYSEAVTRQTTDNFIRCIENAYYHLGGVPRRMVLDNLRAAVKKADWFEPELNPKVRAFAAHYCTVFLPARPYRPTYKGKVERGVGYVQDNALKGRTFDGLESQNQFLLEWERTVADTRLHGTTRHQVGTRFLEVERPALLPLPPGRFPFFHEGRRIVHRDGHVEVQRAYYSVPPEYLARGVWVRWDARMVRVYSDKMALIISHPKQEPGRFSTLGQHIASEKISGIERGAAWLLDRVRRIGPRSVCWAEATIQARGVEGVRVIQGLLSLTGRHDASAIERACEIAHGYGSFRLRTVRTLIDRQVAIQERLPFLDEHPIIRDLSDYQKFVHQSFQKEV
ncbi:MAG: IS21 family transposase [Isosphaerales bacterium]